MATPLLHTPSCGSPPGATTSNRTTRVLLVEDSPSDAHLVCSALADLRDRELYGPVFHISSATSLFEAITCLTHEEIDVILLDLSLPDSESLEQTFADVHRAAPAVPIIVLTGLGDEDLGLKMVRDGAQDYLIKSRVERYLLVKAIRYAVERQIAKTAEAELRLRLLTVQEQERQRIARELHDQMGQSIVALMLGLKSLAASCEPREHTQSQFQQLHNIANELARDVHTLALDLRPTALDDLGLEVALSNYLEGWSTRWQIAADFHCHGLKGLRLASHIETTIYRIAQEALTNVVRHAAADNVSLLLERTDDRIVAIIEDDGRGFDVEAKMKNPLKEQQLGLLGMEERVALVGGSLTIESGPQLGTSVYVRIPILCQPNRELAQ
jgi:signal transduction histidine kinase